MNKPRFKIDFYDYHARPFGLYFAKSISIFGCVEWRVIEAFEDRDKAMAFYERVKNLPEYLP